MSVVPEKHFASPPLTSSASLSPLFGAGSIFVRKMVKDVNLEVGVINLETHFPEIQYTLNDLTSPEDPTCGGEHIARDWIERIMRRQKDLTVLPSSSALPHLSELQAFHTSQVIKPDVTVVTTTDDLPVLTVEVYSQSYNQTVKKALLNAIEQFRILRAYNSVIESCVGFVFPRNAEPSCVTKVEVKFVDFRFTYTLEPIAKQNVRREVNTALTRISPLVEHRSRDYYPYFIRLSTQDCNQFEINAEQVPTKSSIVIRSHNELVYWKYSPQVSELFGSIALVKLLTYTLMPCSVTIHNGLAFYKFKGLSPPKDKEDAKKSLRPLLEQVKDALEELHHHSIAHMDLRLPNICYTCSSNPKVKLIDLDRCEPAYLEVTAHLLYHKSEMYTAGSKAWMNYQLDWKALGLMICSILGGVEDRDYHCMITQNKVTNGVHLHRFVKCLLDEGCWDDSHYDDFCSVWLQGCSNPL